MFPVIVFKSQTIEDSPNSLKKNSKHFKKEGFFVQLIHLHNEMNKSAFTNEMVDKIEN